MVNIAVTGVTGRMGQAIVQTLFAGGHGDLDLSAAIHRESGDILGKDVGELCGVGKLGVAVVAEPGQAEFDLLIDFSQVDASLANLEYCRSHGKALVIGTTGFDESQRQLIRAAAADIPIVCSPNMSIGVNVCFHLVQQAARALGEDCDVEILEAHHRHKLDAPSGTALRFGEIIAAESGRELSECAVYDRAAAGNSRSRNSIGFASLRAGEIVGDHTVMFAAEGELVEISHKASNRRTFAQGAVRAAAWLSRQHAGLYDMQHVLGLER